MSGSFLRHCGRRCANRLMESRNWLMEPHSSNASIASQFLIKQHSRGFLPSIPHFLFKSFPQSETSRTFSSSSSSSSFKNGFFTWYLAMLEARPVLTKSLTATMIFIAADVSSQMITQTSSDSFDLTRTLRMGGYGMLISGPSLHLWFNFVSKILPKRDLLSTLKKMFIGQTVYGPIITCVFFSLNAALQGENGAEIVARLKRDLVPTLVNGLVYWPTCDFITFKFTPVRLQPLVSNSFSFLWTIYITYMASLRKASTTKVLTD